MLVIQTGLSFAVKCLKMWKQWPQKKQQVFDSAFICLNQCRYETIDLTYSFRFMSKRMKDGSGHWAPVRAGDPVEASASSFGSSLLWEWCRSWNVSFFLSSSLCNSTVWVNKINLKKLLVNIAKVSQDTILLVPTAKYKRHLFLSQCPPSGYCQPWKMSLLWQMSYGKS